MKTAVAPDAFAQARDLVVVHSSRGRLRAHLPHWSGKGGRHISAALRRVAGVTKVEPNHVTGNILVLFDPKRTSHAILLDALKSLRLDLRSSPQPSNYDARSEVIEEQIGRHRRARIPVRGLSRDPALAQRVVQRLESSPGTHALANPLTGRITVDYDEKLIHLEDLLAEVAHLELPLLPGEDEPAHPLDPRPLVRSATRVIGSILGLGFVTFQGLFAPAAVGSGSAAAVAGFFNLLHAFPVVHKGMRRVLGETGAEVASHGVTIVALTVADVPLGLVMAGAEALLLLGVVTQRRTAWRRYEDGIDGSTHNVPGSIIRLEPGMRVPRDAKVVEGMGTALSRSGRVLSLAPGHRAPAGARVAGGPFIMELLGGEAFVPQPRPAPPRLDLHRRYLRYAAPISLGYAALAALLSGSLTRGFEAILLVNPYPALVGAEAANLSAASRALRAGLTIVGTHSKRVIRRPDYLLIDGPRVLTDGLELSTVLPLDEALDVPQLLALGGTVATAAGSPWGGVFPQDGRLPATGGAFHGLWASASVQGVRYILGPPKDRVDVEEAVECRHCGGYLLLLAREKDDAPIGLIALRRQLDGGRALEITTVLPIDEHVDAPQLLAMAGEIARAADSPWRRAFPERGKLHAADGAFNGLWASAVLHGERYTLGPPEDPPSISEAVERQAQGGYMLVLAREEDGHPIGFVTIRPRLSRGIAQLVEVCRREGVKLQLLPGVAPETAESVSRRAQVELLTSFETLEVIQERQQTGALVAFVSDGVHAGSGFALSDLAIGMAAGYGGYFPAQADLLAPDLTALADFIDTGSRRDRAVRDGVMLSTACNLLGTAMSLSGPLGYEIAFIPGYVAALAAMGAGLFRLRGGNRPESALGYLTDPRPERWGHRSVPAVLRAFHSSEKGLTTNAATRRSRPRPAAEGREELIAALGKQLRAPTMSLLAGGACLTLVLGQPLNTALIGMSLTINVVAGIWQERQVTRGGEAVQRLGGPTARVLRDGKPVTLPADGLVPGDVLVLMQGDRVSADARVLSADSLEVGEAALTGESLPVAKGPTLPGDHNRIVLEGSDVIVGTGLAVVVAVGRHTRLGATTAAMGVNAERESPLGARLARVLRVALPVALTGGAITSIAAFAYGTAMSSEVIALGVITALSAIPEGLPILAGVGQAAVSQRLAKQNTLVRRLAGIEALGRVDVACTDKTGTLTEGWLSVAVITDLVEETTLPAELSPALLHIMLTAGQASPHPDDPRTILHPTDMAVVRATRAAGLDRELRLTREDVVPFDSARGYYAARVAGRLCIKGAPERIVPRCTLAWGRVLDDAGRRELLEQANALAERGLRILMIAEGPGDAKSDDPQGLTALGFVGMSDRLRPSAAGAIARCHEAGIRVLMLTGDHVGTARTIGREAGLFHGDFDEAITASDLHDLSVEEFDRRIERVAVIARAAPVDKVRIIEGLRRRGHTVAMTGDGVNDAPALRLADVGVAMGKSGTEAARQAADVVLADDEFAQLAEALVEGRSFWRNMRHTLGLLLGGNAGELSLVVGITLAGQGPPLSAAQIWLLSLITDALPSLALVMRPPQQRNLARLAREGAATLDATLPGDTFRRGLSTGLPSLGAYLWTSATAGPVEAGAVTFASLICTQLTQTLDAGHSHGMLSRSSIGAVGSSLAALGFVLGVPGVPDFLGLVAPTAQGWATVGASSAAALLVSRTLGVAPQVPVAAWFKTWKEEMSRLSAMPMRLLPAPRPATAT
jgi:magnesium-transporting ATPase (P-type)